MTSSKSRRDFFSITKQVPALLSVTTHTLNKSFDRLDNVLVTYDGARARCARTAGMLILIKANLNKLKLAPVHTAR
uniref:Transposase n=1 Tax=Ditylenchus dipsaci TaxID=166011 RepID=A0A915EHQ2_9BILA